VSVGHDHAHGDAPARFDRAFAIGIGLQSATRQLHDRFEIEHVTLQAVRTPFTRPCAVRGDRAQ
jgi:hypothetical protein